MSCPICDCRLVARSSSGGFRGLVCADCGHPLLPHGGSAATPPWLPRLLTGGMLVLSGVMALTMALLSDPQFRPETPAQDASTAPSQPTAGAGAAP